MINLNNIFYNYIMPSGIREYGSYPASGCVHPRAVIFLSQSGNDYSMPYGKMELVIINGFVNIIPVADPGFPVGGGGALTSNVGAFWQKHMRKQKNWILLGGGRSPAAPPGSANESNLSCEGRNYYTFHNRVGYRLNLFNPS